METTALCDDAYAIKIGLEGVGAKLGLVPIEPAERSDANARRAKTSARPTSPESGRAPV